MSIPRIPGPPQPFQQFILGLVFLIAVPLLPLLLEHWIRSSVSITSLSLTAAIYAITVGAASNQRLIFGLCIVASLVFSVIFGVVISGTSPPQFSFETASLVIILAALAQSLICWNRHLADGVSFWDFE